MRRAVTWLFVAVSALLIAGAALRKLALAETLAGVQGTTLLPVVMASILVTLDRPKIGRLLVVITSAIFAVVLLGVWNQILRALVRTADIWVLWAVTAVGAAIALVVAASVSALMRRSAPWSATDQVLIALWFNALASLLHKGEAAGRLAAPHLLPFTWGAAAFLIACLALQWGRTRPGSSTTTG